MSKFDSCAQASVKDFEAAEQAGTLEPSMVFKMSTSLAVQGAVSTWFQIS